MLLYPSTNFEIQRSYQNEARLNEVFSRDNLPKKIKDETYVINLDEYADVGTYWTALFCKKKKLFISTVLELNMFLRNLNSSLGIKTSKQTFFKHKQTIQQCLDTYMHWIQ